MKLFILLCFQSFICKTIQIDKRNSLYYYKNNKLYRQNKSGLFLLETISLTEVAFSSQNMQYISTQNKVLIKNLQDSTDLNIFGDYEANRSQKELIEAGNDFVCIQNQRYLNCKGPKQITEGTPLYLSNLNQLNSDYLILSLKANGQNVCSIQEFKKSIAKKYYKQTLEDIVCIFLSHQCAQIPNELSNDDNIYNITNKIVCWGSKETSINQIPNKLKLLDLKNDLQQWDVGRNSVCILFPRLSTQQCWGKCPNKICKIPENIISDIQNIKLGNDHGCVLNSLIKFSAGRLQCWGGNDKGQINTPAEFTNHVVQIELGDAITCALKQNNQIKCWGFIYDSLDFKELQSNNMQKVVTGGRHTCGAGRGDISCWGNDDQGQTELLNASWNMSIVMDAGWDFTCWFNDGIRKASCVGFNYLGQIELPRELEDDQVEYDVLSIKSGLTHSCLVLRRQFQEKFEKVYCWGGHNEFGQLDIPSKMNNNSYSISITVGHDFTCAAYSKTNKIGTQVCFGNNDMGQSPSDPPLIPSYIILSIEAGGAHGCLVQSREIDFYELSCWGSNSHGQLNVPKYSFNNKVTTGDSYTCILRQDTSIKCYGLYLFQLGKQEMASNVGVNQKFSIVQMDSNYEQMCLIDGKKDEAFCLGGNEQGQCDVPRVPEILVSKH